MQKKKKDNGKIGYSSISKVVQILKCFTVNKPVLTVQQISSRVSMPTSSLYRYLQALESADFLHHNESDSTYSVGMYVIELAGVSLMQYQIRYAALPELNKLSDQLNLNTNLSVLDGCDIFHLAFSIKDLINPWLDAIGRRTPAYLTAMGRTMLAYKPFEDVTALITEQHACNAELYPLPDFDALKRDFEKVRQEQTLMVHNCYNATTESYCMACPVRKRTGEVCGAISVNWFLDKAGNTQAVSIPVIQTAVSQTAAKISYKLGYLGKAYGSQ